MIIKVDIYSGLQDSNTRVGVRIKTVEITEEEVAEFVLEKYKFDYESAIRDDRHYYAEVDEIIHN